MLIMKLLLGFLFFFIFCSIQSIAQWSVLPNSPTENFRHDDVYFLNVDTGFVVNNQGAIWKTEDGGGTWNLKLNMPNTYFRCIAFLNDTLGFVGTLGDAAWHATTTNDTVLYKTSDGGETWSSIYSAIAGDKSEGLCGLNKVNDSTIIGVGRIGGPTHFLRSTDYGATWTSKDMSSYLGSLIEAHFISPDTGLIFGGTDMVNGPSRGIILKTVDAGLNWDTVYVTSKQTEWCWKVFFPSDSIGYVTLQSARNDTINFLKTVDGGVTWVEKPLVLGEYWAQGVGFLNDTVGWIGGDLNQPHSYVTKDGGETWDSIMMGDPINRIRKGSDDILYAVGHRVYKYDHSLVLVPEIENNRIDANLFPVPVNDFLYVSASFTFDEVYVYDYAGREIISTFLQEGNLCKIDVSLLGNGIYLLIAKQEGLFLKKMFIKK